MIPALSQVCSLPCPFAQDIEDYAAGHCRTIEVWLTKLETHRQQYSADQTRKLLEDHGITTPAGGFQAAILVSQGEQRRQAWDQLRRRLDLLREIDAQTIIVAGDIGGSLDAQALDRAKASLHQAASEAAERRMKVALEFQSRSAFANNLQTAAALVEEIGHPQLGLCFDIFHFYTGPSKESDLALLTLDNLFHVQLCDLADTPREFATDSDRILPGDGDIPVAPLLERLQSIDYQGPVSVEIMNPEIWRTPPRQFGEIAITSLRKVLGLAEI